MEVVLNDVSFFDHDHETRSGSSGSGSGNGSGSGSGAAYSARFRLRGPHKRGEMRQYVDKASLHLQPGSVTALIGSPEETSHLLEIIGLRQHSGFIAGSIYHDNSIRKNGSCFRDIAYVKDFDSNFFGHLTVEAFLMWASQLRLALSEAECSARAREAAKILNLEGHVQIKDLRRGQRILLSVAAELVENPTLICIDSPIDFMEESHVSAVVRAFNKISHRQNTSTTIVFTAIAPSANSLKYIDQLALFFNTKLLYSSGEMFDYKNPKLGNISKGHGNSKFGNGYHKKMGIAGEKDENALKFRQIVAECQDVLCTLFRDISRSGYGTTYFASQFVSSDHRVSSYKKDAESQTIFSIKRVEAIEERIFKHLTVIASKTEGYENLHDDESKMSLASMSPPGRFTQQSRPLRDEGPSRQRRLHPSRVVRTSQPFYRETTLLVVRSWCCIKENALMGWMVVLRLFVSGIILGAMSFSAGDDAGEETSADDFYNEDSFAVASTLFAIVLINVMGLGLSIPFMNSHTHMLKSEIASGIYNPLSAWAALFIHDVPLQVAGSMCLAVVVRLFLKLEDNFGAYYVAVFLCAMCSASLAAAVAVGSTNGYRSAQAYLTCASVICLFSGYLRTVPDMPSFFQWLTDFSFGRWAFELLMLSAFQDTSTGDEYLDGYGFKNQAMSACVFWMLLWSVLLQIVVLTGLFPFAYKSVYSRLDQFTAKAPPMETSSTGNSLHLLDKSSIVSCEGSYMDVTQHRSAFCDSPTLPPLVISLPETKKTSLSFVDVGFSLNADDAKSKHSFMHSTRVRLDEDGDTVVLKGITGDVMPGEMCCIVDGSDSGAGDILLQVLSARATVYGKVSGDIRISDKILMQGDFVHNSALVIRGDSKSHSCLTVRETLEYAALLRRTDQRSCPLVIHVFLRWRQVSLLRKLRAKGRRQNAADDFIEFNDEEVIATSGQVQEKVDEILRVFDLEDVAEVPIGSYTHCRRISPSQMRLLTIATEAINRPGLLYLQDPFFSLDWYHADRVCRVLRAVAAGGRAIICTLPNPTDDIFSQFHKTLLINHGLLLFHGLTSGATNHFKNIGFEPKEGQSDLTFLTDICQEKAQMGTVSATTARKSSLLTTEDLVNIRISMSDSTDNFSSLSPSASMDTVGACAQEAPTNSIYTPMMGPVIRRSDTSVGPAGRVIAIRRSVMAFRNIRMVMFYYVCSLLFGTVLGGMWYSLDDGDIHGRILVATVAYLYMTANLSGLLNGTHRRQDDYLRERDSGASTGTSYWLGDGVPVIVHSIPHVILFAAPLYLMAGLRPGFNNLGYFCLLFFFAMYCNIGLMYLVTGVTKDALMSRVLFLGAVIPLQLLFSGSIVYLSSMYDWLSIFSYLNPMQFFLSGVFTNEFHDNSNAIGNEDVTYGDVKEKYGFHGDVTGSLIALLLIGIGYRILWLYSLKYREVYEKRHVMKKVIFNAHNKVSSFVSSRMNSVSARKGGRSSRSRHSAAAGLASGAYFDADELDHFDEATLDDDEYDSDQLSSKHSISEFVLSPYNDDENEGISLPRMGAGLLNSTDGKESQSSSFFRREMPQAQTTPPSRSGGHNRIIIVPKSGSKSGGSNNNTPTQYSPPPVNPSISHKPSY